MKIIAARGAHKMGTMTAFSPIKKKRGLSPAMVLVLTICLVFGLYGVLFIAGLVT